MTRYTAFTLLIAFSSLGVCEPGPEAEKMPWELSVEEQAALRAKAGVSKPVDCSRFDSAEEMTADSIRNCFEVHNPAIGAIYQRYLREHKGVKGAVVFSLTIDPAGTVTEISVAGEPEMPSEIVQKIESRVGVIVFPKSAHGWSDKYALMFYPE